MIKLISINIEGDKHLERVLPFIEKEQPDVLCLQEVLACNIALFEGAMGGKSQHVAMGTLPSNRNNTGSEQPIGIGILSRLPLRSIQSQSYVKYEGVPAWDDPNSVNRVVLAGEIESQNKRYVIATTHFTWTHDGRPNERQHRGLDALLNFLSRYSDITLVGDFNAPRGMAIFDRLAEKYKDNIPLHYDTSLDPELHITKGKLHYVVDHLFTSPGYQALDTRLQFGVSDHAAIVANLR